MRRIALTLTITALAVAAGVSAAHAGPDDPTSRPAPDRRLVCLDGTRQLYLTPDEENTPGHAPVPGPCPGQAPPTTSTETVTLCIQGVTTTGHRGSTNPNGYFYAEGACDASSAATAPTTSTPRVKTPAVKARPRFTG